MFTTLKALLLLHLTLAPVLGQFFCDQKNKNQEKCNSYAILRPNSHFSSMSNITSYLNITLSELAKANNFSTDNSLFDIHRIIEQPFLIPLECKCITGNVFEAEIQQTMMEEGESFSEIAESFEGLTTDEAVKVKNPNFSDSDRVFVPLICACPYSKEINLISYPLIEGDTVSDLAITFNITQESIISTNKNFSKSNVLLLLPFSTLLLPLQKTRPVYTNALFDKSPNETEKPEINMLAVYIATPIAALLACVAAIFGAVFVTIEREKKKKKFEQAIIKTRPRPRPGPDLEILQLGLSIRTTSDQKVSFEGSQYNHETRAAAKAPPENYALEDLKRATEDFGPGKLISGSVFHGRLKGKNVAIKRVPSDSVSELDRNLFDEMPQRHMVTLLGTCLTDGPDSFLVFEYARNGSLKDWIHGGLAIKIHFIESCSCFLTWSQRLKICLDLATGLHHVHHVMNPIRVHGNVRSRNVFLDEDFGAKFGYFGLGRCIGSEPEDPPSSQGQNWNRGGYLAPESVLGGTVLTSPDIFAYGVILLEVLSGKPPVRRDAEEEGEFIKLCDEIKLVLKSDGGDELREWMDCTLGESYPFEEAVMLANLGKSCVEDDVALRPNTGEIVQKLLTLVEDSADQGSC